MPAITTKAQQVYGATYPDKREIIDLFAIVDSEASAAAEAADRVDEAIAAAQAADGDAAVAGALAGQAAAAAVVGGKNTLFSKVVTDYSGFANLVADLTSGSLGVLPAGEYDTSPVVIDLSANTQEPMDDQKRPSLRGAGGGSTVIKGTEIGEYALTVTSAPGTAAHSYQTIGDFSIGRTVLGAHGLKLKNLVFLQVQNMVIQSCDVGLDLESVLSSKFDNLVIEYNRIGILGSKGAGFSDVNANVFNAVKIREQVEVGAQYGPTSLVSFYGGSVEGNGTQGEADMGGLDLSFTGAEGAVGANIDGLYFEGNKGGYDIRLTNEGAVEITVIIKACIFNRISAAAFVTNHVQIIGPIRVVFDSCAFLVLNDYARNAGRQIVDADEDATVTFRNCVGIYGNIDTIGCINEEDRDHAGRVNSGGAAISLPRGWSSSKVGDGIALVTHDLGDAGYSLGVSVNDTNGGVFLERVVTTANAFQVITRNGAGSYVDVPFDFLLRRYGGRN